MHRIRRIRCRTLRFDRLPRSLYPAALLLAAALECRAIDRFWDNPLGGSFNSGANWQGSVAAGINDIARFGLTTNPNLAQRIYTVSFAANATNQALKIEDDFVTFDLNGRTYATTFTTGNEIGNQLGRSGRLTIIDGTMSTAANSQLLIGRVPNSSGALTVSAAGRLAGGADILLGAGSLTVETGGLLNVFSGNISAVAGAVATATVTGADATWINTGTMVVDNGTLNITAGGRVQDASAVVAAASGGTGTVIVDGASSVWENLGALAIGDSGSGALNVTKGGKVQNTNAFVGLNAGSTGRVTVRDSDSLWENSGRLIIGNDGDGRVDILNGGRVTSQDTDIGRDAAGIVAGTGTVTVSGVGSQWINSGQLRLALLGDANLNIDNGGLVQSGPSEIEFDDSEGDIAAVTVRGLGSRWITTGNLAFGAGTLDITDGGEVRNPSVVMLAGIGTATTKAVATISGKDSKWVISNDLTLAHSGGGHTLNIHPGGLVSVGGATIVRAGIKEFAGVDKDGVINLLGGELNTRTLDVAGTFNFRAGTLRFTSDAALTDALLNKVLGPEHRIVPLQHLAITGTPSMETLLVLDGGTFSVPSLQPGSPLQFRTGTLNLTSDTLTIGASGLFGEALALSNRHINITNAAAIQNNARLILNDGSLSAGVSLANEGEILLQNALSQIAGGPLANAGVIRGAGVIRNNVHNTATGLIEATDNQRLKLAGTVTSDGTMNLRDGTIEVAGAFSTTPASRITGRGTLIARAGLTHRGQMQFSGGFTDIYGNVTLEPGSRIIVSGGSTTTFYDALRHNGQEVRIAEGSRLTLFGAVSGTGSFTGPGTVDVEGIFSPGNSPAIVQVEGNLAFTPSSTLQIEIGGTTPGSQHDQLLAGGRITLDGTLQIALIDGFSPRLGDVFDLFNASLTGRFAAAHLPTLDDNLSWDTSALHSTGMIAVVPEPAGLGIGVLCGLFGLLRLTRPAARDALNHNFLEARRLR